MRGFAVVAVGLALSGGIIYGQVHPGNQTPSQDSVATLKANTRVVLLDVVVTDKKGEPVTNLVADDFKIYEDGKLQKVASFALIGKATPTTKPLAQTELGPGVYYNRRGLEGQQGQLTVLLLDRLNTPLGDQHLVRQQILKYLETHKNDGQPIAIFGLRNSLTLLQDFTTDTALLRTVLEAKDVSSSSLLADPASDNLIAEPIAAGLQASPSSTPPTAANQSMSRTLMTQRALKVLSEWVAGFPGRKKLIWFSTLFPAGSVGVGNNQGFYVGMGETLTLLSENQISVYPVNAGAVQGLASGSGVFSASNSGRLGDRVMTGQQFGSAVRGQLGALEMNNAMMRMIAEQTGGVAYGGNDLSEAISNSISDGSFYYAISFSPENKTWDKKFRKLEVKTEKHGLHLRYRPGYFALDPLQAASQGRAVAKRELDSALYSPVLATALPFYGTAQSMPAETAASATANNGSASPAGFHGRTLIANETVLGKEKTHPVDVGFLIQLSELSYELTGNDTRSCSVELFVGVFAANNKLVGHVEESMDGNIKGEAFAKMGSAGTVFHTTVQVPNEKVRLRLIVRDNRSGKIGALDVPYPNEVAAK